MPYTDAMISTNKMKEGLVDTAKGAQKVDIAFI